VFVVQGNALWKRYFGEAKLVSFSIFRVHFLETFLSVKKAASPIFDVLFNYPKKNIFSIYMYSSVPAKFINFIVTYVRRCDLLYHLFGPHELLSSNLSAYVIGSGFVGVYTRRQCETLLHDKPDNVIIRLSRTELEHLV